MKVGNKTIKKLICLIGLLAVQASLAHHGNFTFDGATVLTLEGNVIRFEYTNPHGLVVMQTTDGREVHVEVDGPSLIRPMGTRENSLQPGDSIIAYVSPSNRGRDNEFLGREIVKPDGTLVRVSVAFARQQERRNPPVSDSIIGTWVPDRSNLFTHVAASENWKLTEAGQLSFDTYDTSESFAQAECIAATAPTLMMYPTANQIIEQDGYLEINADWMGASRTVYMDDRTHPPSSEQYYQGYSVGHWEGKDLVIETTNFTPNEIGNIFSIASGEKKQLMERFSLDDTGTTLTYTYILTDPEFLAEPVAASYQWQFRPDITVSNASCDRDAASRFLR